VKLTNIVEGEYKDVFGAVIDTVVPSKEGWKLAYEVMSQTNTYAEGVYALRNFYEETRYEAPKQLLYACDGQKIIRPMTFKENILARVEDFETRVPKDGTKRTLDDRLKLFRERLDSCSAIAYSSQNKDEFMIIPLCKELITIPKDLSNNFISICYSDFQGRGISLKYSQAKYNLLLTESEVISHPAWIAAVEEDMRLLIAYSGIMFDNMKLIGGKTAGFFLHNEMKSEDMLLGIFVKSNINNSDIGGSSIFCTPFSFLCATQL